MAGKNSREMAKLAYEALADKKAQDIKIINIEEVSVLADYFIIASGSNRNQVQAMADNVDEVLHKAGYPVRQTEGYSTANWILMDYLTPRTVCSMISSVSGEMERTLQ